MESTKTTGTNPECSWVETVTVLRWVSEGPRMIQRSHRPSIMESHLTSTLSQIQVKMA